MPKPPPMDPTELRTILDGLGWSQRDLSRFADVTEGDGRGMARGTRPIPAPLAHWLRQLDALIRNPPRLRGKQQDPPE